MSNFLNLYPIFEDNQVLTSSQLNDTVAYLEEQNRLTRTKLIGTGIACGFDLTYSSQGTPLVTSIAFSTGLGITSEGYVISQGDCLVKRYRPYHLPAGVHYPPFENPVTKVEDVAMYELLTDDAPTLPSDVITPLDPAFCAGKVVVMFIETVEVDLQSCLGKACDENGKERVFNLRKLLISKNDFDTKIFQRTCQENLPFQKKYSLPEISIKRPILNSSAGSASSRDYFAFSQTYANAIKSAVNPSVGTADIYTTLFSALNQTYVDFLSVLSPVYGGVNPFNGYPKVTWTEFTNGFSGGPKYLGMQYFYDFIEDLILAYNQFREVAFDLVSACCSDMSCFPLHLMLGEVIPSQINLPSKYRHYFIPSPIFNNQKERLDEVIFYHKRLVLMLRMFNLNTINPLPAAPVPQTLITPSKEKRGPMSERSIPYYYNITLEDTELKADLNHTWNYTFKKKWLYGKGLLPLAYGNLNGVQAADAGPVKTPLFYDTDPYDFFRIEGHLRKTYLAAKNEIEDLKNAFDLPFNVVTLRLNGKAYDDIAERCNFDDLRTNYGILRTEILSLADNVFDRFGTIGTSGVPVAKELPSFISGLLGNLIKTTKNGSVTQPQIGFGTQEVTVSPYFFPAYLPGLNFAAFNAVPSDSMVSVSEAGPGSVNGAIDVSRSASVMPTFDLSKSLGVNNIVIQSSGPLYAQQHSLAEIQTGYYTDALEMVKALNSLRTLCMPFNITAFKYGYTGLTEDSVPGFIQYYKTALQRAINIKVGYNQLLDLITRNTALRNTPELYADLLAYWTETVGLLERFITDARHKSLAFVNYTLQYRINKLKENDMTLFSNFIKKHPGVKHMGGVQPGGTFILVYNGDTLAVDVNAANYVVEQAKKKYQYQTRKAQILAKPVQTAQDQIELAEIEAALLNLSATSNALAGSVPVQSIALNGNQVVADFSLPYLCCCDCECDEIPHVTDAVQLGMPAIAMPFYAEYSLGDYAYAKDSDIGIHNLPNTVPVWFYIDIIPLLQYETSYNANRIRLYLIDKYGTKVAYTAQPVSIGTGINAVSTVATFNDCNLPSNTTSFGTAAVVSYSSAAIPQKLAYKPETGFCGTDSFYYVFEILDAQNNVIRRSGMGKITITVDTSNSLRNVSYGNIVLVQQVNSGTGGMQQG